VTRVVQCWDGMKRESFVWEGIQRCRSSQTRTLTTCFNGSLSMTRTTWHRTVMSGLVLVVWTMMSNGDGSTDNRQVLMTLRWLNLCDAFQLYNRVSYVPTVHVSLFVRYSVNMVILDRLSIHCISTTTYFLPIIVPLGWGSVAWVHEDWLLPINLTKS